MTKPSEMGLPRLPGLFLEVRADFKDKSAILSRPGAGVGVGVRLQLTAKSANFAFHGVTVGKRAVRGFMPPTRRVLRSAAVTGRGLTFRGILLQQASGCAIVACRTCTSATQFKQCSSW